MIQLPHIEFIDGNNFSGRTHYLKSITGLDPDGLNTADGVYLGSVPSNYISGLATRVKEEFQLHSDKGASDEALNFIIQTLGLSNILHSNPFTLSGGEQAMVALINATLLRPNCVAIDTLLEQVNEQWKLPFLEMSLNGQFGDIKFLIADNRSDEIHLPIEHIKVPFDFPDEEIVERHTFHPIDHKRFSAGLYSHDAVSLSIRNLSYRYKKGPQVLEDVNIDLAPGIVYHLEGVNGAGKSTLSKLLAGILKMQDNSKLLVDSVPVNLYRHPGKVVGYSFQNPDEQLFETTVEEEILPKSFSSEVEVRRRQMLLEAFGLQDVAYEHPGDMPFTIRKRIALAATFGMDRPWYILDEPTIGLDNDNSFSIGEIIKALTNIGKSVILISHAHFLSNILTTKTILLKGMRLHF